MSLQVELITKNKENLVCEENYATWTSVLEYRKRYKTWHLEGQFPVGVKSREGDVLLSRLANND